MSTLPLLIIVVVVLLVGIVVARRANAARRVEIDNEVRQAMLQQLVGYLGEAFADPTLSTEDVEAIAANLIGQMRHYNVDGQLDAFIADNEEAVAEKLAARRAAFR